MLGCEFRYMLSTRLGYGIYPDEKYVNPLADCFFECADYVLYSLHVEEEGLNPQQTSSFFSLIPLWWDDGVTHIVKQRNPRTSRKHILRELYTFSS